MTTGRLSKATTRVFPACVLTALALAGCGPDTEPLYTNVPPNVPAAPNPVSTATAQSTKSGGATGEKQQGGGGDEVPANVPFTFIISRGRVLPVQVTVPAYIKLILTFDSHDDEAHKVKINVPGGPTVTVGALGDKKVTLPGLKPGNYTVTVEGGDSAKIVVGGDVGP